MAKGDLCVWCACNPGTRRHDAFDGRICDACNVYEHKYGVLPPPRVVYKRLARVMHSPRRHGKRSRYLAILAAHSIDTQEAS